MFLKAFCDGAGIPCPTATGTDSMALARELGRCVRIATEEMRRMLDDRANVKLFTKGGARTMRAAFHNNPVKFLDSDSAIAAMFLDRREGFMTGADGFENALSDLRRHQLAVFAALQPALAHVLSGLSPEEIEDVTEGGGLLSGRRAKSWDTFVARWDAKMQEGENGMLDSFLKAFADAYMQVAGNKNF